MTKTISQGIFYGVGVGPGDPELLTLKACRLIESADLGVYLSNDAGASHARDIARIALENSQADQQELAVHMPMLNDRQAANTAYDGAAEKIAKALDKQAMVVFLCEGDPLFFGSFAYLLVRLEEKYRCEVVPGICSVNAASAALKQPLAQLNENMAVISGRHSNTVILQALKNYDNLIILKAGQGRVRLLELLAQSGRSHDARYLEYIGRDEQKIETDITRLESTAGPYFSLFVISPSRGKQK